MTIHLPKDLETRILAAVESGRFPSVDAAMTDAAGLLLEKLKQSEANPPAASSSQQQKPIWEEIVEMTADVPDEEWDKLPTDLAEQHDHYLYGTPKRPPS
jgi:Arc/MetJ-type ribon-helix-helix transcriptional regulator